MPYREGAAVSLDEADLVPVELTFFYEEDLARGPEGESPTRVSDLKFGRIHRYASEARSQGAFSPCPIWRCSTAFMSMRSDGR